MNTNSTNDTNGHTAIKIEDVKIGEFIRRKIDAKTTYTRGAFCRFDRKYACGDESDISREIMLKKGTIVYVGFTY